MVALHPVKLRKRHSEQFGVIEAFDTEATISQALLTTCICLDNNSLLLVKQKLSVIDYDVFDAKELEVAWSAVHLDASSFIALVFEVLFRVDDGEDFVFLLESEG